MTSMKFFATLGLAAVLAGGATVFAQSTPPDTKAPDKPAKKEDKTDKGPKEGHDGRKAAVERVGKPAPAFTLKDSNGKSVSLSDFAGKTVVLEWINPDCPVCKDKVDSGSVAKMIAASHAADKNVVFLFINSTHYMAEKPSTSGEYLASAKIAAPALIDGDGTVGKAYGAKTTPHCFVIDPKGVLVYDGAIDDKGSTNYVVNAVKAIKEGKPVAPATTTAYGCGVKYKK